MTNMTTENRFLGSGWRFPPVFNKSNTGATMSMVSGPENIAQSLRVLLSTNFGERLMHPDYGTNLNSLLFESIDQRTISRIENYISDAILLYEPRITLTNLNVVQDQFNPGLLRSNIEYNIKATNSRFNLVYPFYINEANTGA